jgi:hypothetical protein
MADKKDTKSARTKMIEDMPSNAIQRGAAKVSNFLDKMGVRQEDKYEGKTKDDVVKKAEGGMIKNKEKMLKEILKKGGSRPSVRDQERAESMLSGKDEKEEKSNSRISVRDQEKAEKLMGYKKGGMVTARGQGKVMKTKSCKMY